MGQLEFFLKNRKISPKCEEFAVSKNFTDDEGLPVLWRIKPISAARDEEIRLAIGELFGLAGVNEGATFSPNNIKLVENVFVECDIAISLIDKGVTEGGDQGNAQTFLYDIACKNVFNASELGPTDYLTFYKVDVGAPNEHRVDYAAQSSDLADMAAFGTAQLTNNFWKVIRDKEDAIIGAELTFIQNS